MGRLTSKAGGGLSFGWNAVTDELNSSTAGLWNSIYAYDSNGRLAASSTTRDGMPAWNSLSWNFGADEITEKIDHSVSGGTTLSERWIYYHLNDEDNLAGATRTLGGETRDYFFVTDHLGSIVLTLQLNAEERTVPIEQEGPPEGSLRVFAPDGTSTDVNPDDGTIALIADDESVCIAQEGEGILLDSDGESLSIRGEDGEPLQISAEGEGIILKSSQGADVITDETGALLVEPDADNNLRVSSANGQVSVTVPRFPPSNRQWYVGLAPVEAYEYTPYGVPTIHARTASGAASTRVLRDANTELVVGGPPLRDGIEYGSYLSVADSPRGATDQSAWVSRSAAASSIGFKYLFACRPWNPIGEVSYNRARWYSPHDGRFISRDPIGYGGGLNQYTYCNGNPLNFTDPSGLEPETTTEIFLDETEKDLEEVSNSPIGMIPGVGDGLDAALMATKIANGKPGEAAFIAATLVPGGDSLKLAKKAERIIDAAGDSRKVADDVVDACVSGGCFAEGTLVWTPAGPVAIESLKPGDVVLAADPESGDVHECRVLAVSRNEQRQTVSLTAGEETLAATPNHPIWVENMGWTNAGALVPGATIHLLDGSQTTIAASPLALPQTATVYNLEVEGLHTYFVGADGWLVHNGAKCPSPNGRKGSQDHQDQVQDIVQDVNDRGLTPVTEYHVPTPGGHKENRYVDVAAVDKDKNPVEFHQVGRTNKDGTTPVSRERRAEDDINTRGGGPPVKFWPLP